MAWVPDSRSTNLLQSACTWSICQSNHCPVERRTMADSALTTVTIFPRDCQGKEQDVEHLSSRNNAQSKMFSSNCKKKSNSISTWSIISRWNNKIPRSVIITKRYIRSKRSCTLFTFSLGLTFATLHTVCTYYGIVVSFIWLNMHVHVFFLIIEISIERSVDLLERLIG